MVEEKTKLLQIEGAEEVPSDDTEGADKVRRDLLKKIGTGVFASLLLPSLFSKKASALAKLPEPEVSLPDLPELPDAVADEDPIVRMMRDLKRALAKPLEQRKWSMVIDLRKCVGCESCTVSCIAENKLPPGVVYRPVLEEEIGTYPHVTRKFVPRPCMHCENPPCTPVCPVRATYKREDGIVVIDYDKCIGCRYCVTSCPYGARSFDFGENYTDDTPVLAAYEKEPNFEYGREWKREGNNSPVGNARKCHFCDHRVREGLLPMCVVSCIGRATFFGDANDPDSLVSELIGKPNVMRLKEELGTRPKVYYLV
ncbi:MAG: 4Fe-4S dicluster domain-containing protein [Calditrichaeota bacterium]|nr:MAG: 4Fe-4S dicluster domain-containing protein [Calditrichota bacterium]